MNSSNNSSITPPSDPDSNTGEMFTLSDNAIIGGSALLGTGLIFGSGYFIGKKIVAHYASRMDMDAAPAQQQANLSGTTATTPTPTTAASTTPPPPSSATTTTTQPKTAAAAPTYAKFARKMDPKTQKPLTVMPSTSSVRNPKELDPKLVEAGLKYARRAFVYGTVAAFAGVSLLAVGIWKTMGVSSMQEFHDRMNHKVTNFMHNGIIGVYAKRANHTLSETLKNNPLNKRLNKVAENVELTQEDYDIAQELSTAVETILNYEIDVVSFIRRKPSRAQNPEITLKENEHGQPIIDIQHPAPSSQSSATTTTTGVPTAVPSSFSLSEISSSPVAPQQPSSTSPREVNIDIDLSNHLRDKNAV